MTLNDLLFAISNNKEQSLAVQHHEVKHGNRNQEGDYNTITIQIGEKIVIPLIIKVENGHNRQLKHTYSSL